MSASERTKATAPVRSRSAWRIPVGAALLLLASAAFHTVVLVLDGGPWDGPVSWRKPITFGLSFGVSVLTVTWICRLLPLAERTRTLLLAAFTAASLLETGLITLQAWRGVPSHFNTETTFDAFVTRALAAGGITLIAVVVALTVAALRPAPGVDPGMRLALRAGLVALTGSMAAGAVMIAYGLTLEGAGRAAEAYRSAGFLRPAHAVTMHAVLLLPSLAWLLSRTRRPEAERLRLIRVTVAAYGAVAALVTAAAAVGLTLADPATTAVVSAVVTTAPALAFLAFGVSPSVRENRASTRPGNPEPTHGSHRAALAGGPDDDRRHDA
ncbi:hypothetical protein [Streptomyces gardneri]|uniref:Uncharacterized protein n=1 Tax=Streptomyces gardneri TaxID=66892 RepID=A0A4Y3RIB6_9ACTN|nr:hypothetical protein [Streptomyces gardneri]GEB55580.1 hypothetical protein SGA01_11850 [Streptomyces gardneri]GHH14764.1 hypothetical protein GCM10017674_63310 [Streptomyces gardneri]